jgi:hypothetical protein
MVRYVRRKWEERERRTVELEQLVIAGLAGQLFGVLDCGFEGAHFVEVGRCV